MAPPNSNENRGSRRRIDASVRAPFDPPVHSPPSDGTISRVSSRSVLLLCHVLRDPRGPFLGVYEQSRPLEFRNPNVLQ